MKKINVIILFLFSLNLVAQTNTKQNGVKASVKKDVVYTTDTGTKYHKATCRYLKKSKIETTLQKVKAAKYSPCSVCKPGGTVTTKSKKSSSDGRCSATTQKGARCKRSAASGSNKCWQH